MPRKIKRHLCWLLYHQIESYLLFSFLVYTRSVWLINGVKTGAISRNRREVGGATAVSRRASAAIGSRRIQSALVIRDQPLQSALVSERVRWFVASTRKRDATASVVRATKNGVVSERECLPSCHPRFHKQSCVHHWKRRPPSTTIRLLPLRGQSTWGVRHDRVGTTNPATSLRWLLMQCVSRVCFGESRAPRQGIPTVDVFIVVVVARPPTTTLTRTT